MAISILMATQVTQRNQVVQVIGRLVVQLARYRVIEHSYLPPVVDMNVPAIAMLNPLMAALLASVIVTLQRLPPLAGPIPPVTIPGHVRAASVLGTFGGHVPESHYTPIYGASI